LEASPRKTASMCLLAMRRPSLDRFIYLRFRLVLLAMRQSW
jgi:hypothetical protein